MTLDMALAYRRAYVEWCERSMRLLEEKLLEEGPPRMDLDHTAHGGRE
jgi:hypothetical protein